MQKYYFILWTEDQYRMSPRTSKEITYCNVSQCLTAPHSNMTVQALVFGKNKRKVSREKNLIPTELRVIGQGLVVNPQIRNFLWCKHSWIISFVVHRGGPSLSTPSQYLSNPSNIMATFKSKFKLYLTQVCGWAFIGYSGGVLLLLELFCFTCIIINWIKHPQHQISSILYSSKNNRNTCFHMLYGNTHPKNISL